MRTATKVTLAVVILCLAVASGLVWHRIAGGRSLRRQSERALTFVLDNPKVSWNGVRPVISLDTEDALRRTDPGYFTYPKTSDSRYARHLLTAPGIANVTAIASASTLTIGDTEAELGPAEPVTSGFELTQAILLWYRYGAVDIATDPDGTVHVLRVDGATWRGLVRQ